MREFYFSQIETSKKEKEKKITIDKMPLKYCTCWRNSKIFS